MSLAVGTRIGNLEVVEPLGTGGMGEVYRARGTGLDRSVAVKSRRSGRDEGTPIEKFQPAKAWGGGLDDSGIKMPRK